MALNELKVLLTGDASSLSASLQTASGKLQSFGKSVSGIGASLSKISVPLALAGGAAIKMGADFDKSMTQIKSLVGVASAEVDRMGEAVKEMAAATGRDANEAAEALFFITSAGLRGSEALDVLNASLKASAVGLGETKIVADLATSAMNAYGSEVLSATDATDIMVTAVREGKLEASELAASMGRVLPIASAMGVGFEEVGAAFAALSRTGTNAAEAATQVRGIFSSLLKPTTDAEIALNQMGLSSAGLRRSLKEDGLLATLEILKANFEGNDTAAQRVFGNVRALSGIMDLLGSNVETTRQIFSAMENTLNATDKAFKINSQSAGFQLTKSLNDLKVAFTQLGAELIKTFLPYIKAASAAIINLFKGFQELSPTAKKSIIILGGIVTVLGPALIIVGNMITAIGALSGAITTVASSAVIGKLIAGVKTLNITMLANPYAAIAAGVISLGTAFVTAANEIAPSLSTWEQLKTAISGIAAPMSISGRLAMAEADKIGEAARMAAAAASAVGNEVAGPQLPGAAPATDYGSILATNAPAQSSQPAIAAPLFVDPTPELQKMKDATTMGITEIANAYDWGGELLTTKQAYFSEGMLANLARAQEFTSGLNDILQGGLQNLAVGIGTALGEAVATGASVSQSLSKVLLGTLGGMATQVGKLAIGVGIALEGIKKALANINPVIAVAAGIALVALGSYVSSRAAAIGQGGGSGATPFAKGGIVSGPTNALIGEYPGARSNPEVVAPLDKLQGMINKNGSGSNVNVTGEFVVRGQDLVLALQRAEKQNNRI
jgi:TP901 family phage tail tape measure protein